MKQDIIYDDDARYTDAPPEIDEAFDYAVEHNLFLSKKQIDKLFNRNIEIVSQPRRTFKKATAAML